jgi:hypothetical protein
MGSQTQRFRSVALTHSQTTLSYFKSLLVTGNAEKIPPLYWQGKSAVHRRASWLPKRLGKPPCPSTPGYITYDARVCLLGLGCEYGMGRDLPTAIRAATARVVEI